MKKVLILMMILTQAFIYHACNNNKDKQTTDRSVIIANESDVDDDGKVFMKAAAIGGVMEVELAKVAQKQASSPEVKKFADMMIADHTRIYNDLKKLATDKHILLPITMEAAQKEQLNKMQALQGSTFDETYMRMMVTSHEKAIKDYEDGATNRDRQVNHFASENMKTLQDHLKSARAAFNNVIIKR
jgi:putative membrane protein